MGQLFGWTLYLVFLVAIVLIGWEQPLKARFGLRPAPPAPQPQAAAPSWMNDNSRWDKDHHSAPAPSTVPPESGSSQ